MTGLLSDGYSFQDIFSSKVLTVNTIFQVTAVICYLAFVPLLSPSHCAKRAGWGVLQSGTDFAALIGY